MVDRGVAAAGKYEGAEKQGQTVLTLQISTFWDKYIYPISPPI